jgi:cytochrome c oxidase subunit 4
MAESAEDIRHHVAVYMKVFLALFVLTIVTVAASYLHLDSVAMTVTIALFIASIKGTLVACYFMHLIDERSIIYWVLIITAVFFVVLMFVPLLAEMNSVGV